MEKLFAWDVTQYPKLPENTSYETGAAPKLRGLSVVEHDGYKCLKKVYPEGRIGAKTKTSEADLTRINFNLNSKAQGITFEYWLWMPSETAEEVNAMKIGLSSNTPNSRAFYVADDYASCILMAGDKKDGNLQLWPYYYAEWSKYKRSNDGKHFPDQVKYWQDSSPYEFQPWLPNDQWVGIRQFHNLGTPGQADGSSRLYMNRGNGWELFWAQENVKWTDAEIFWKYLEFVTFQGGGNVSEYAPSKDVVAYFRGFCAYEGDVSLDGVSDPIEPDPIEPGNHGEPDPSEVDMLRLELAEKMNRVQTLISDLQDEIGIVEKEVQEVGRMQKMNTSFIERLIGFFSE